MLKNLHVAVHGIPKAFRKIGEKDKIYIFVAGGIGPSSAQTFVCDRLVVVTEEEEEVEVEVEKREEKEEKMDGEWTESRTLGEKL